MREGSDFKLKVVTSCSSVLVAFRSPEFAEAILSTAKSLAQTLPSGHQAGIVAYADVHGPLNFGDEVQGWLPECRQDADKLQRECEGPGAAKAIQKVSQHIHVAKGAGRVKDITIPGEEDAEGFVSIGKGGRTTLTRAETTHFSSGSHPGKGKADCGLQRAQTTAIGSGGYYTAKGKAGGCGGKSRQRASTDCPSPEASDSSTET